MTRYMGLDAEMVVVVLGVTDGAIQVLFHGLILCSQIISMRGFMSDSTTTECFAYTLIAST